MRLGAKHGQYKKNTQNWENFSFLIFFDPLSNPYCYMKQNPVVLFYYKLLKSSNVKDLKLDLSYSQSNYLILSNLHECLVHFLLINFSLAIFFFIFWNTPIFVSIRMPCFKWQLFVYLVLPCLAYNRCL